MPTRGVQAPADDDRTGISGRDDTLMLLFLCCHPDLTPPSQLALTLRAVGGLTTNEIARAFLVPEATMTQRIVRAKKRIREGDGSFGQPSPSERAERLPVVLHVLYLMFTERYAATAGDPPPEAIVPTKPSLRSCFPPVGSMTSAGLVPPEAMVVTRDRLRR